MPFCRECGKEVQDNWVTCPFCSSNLPTTSVNDSVVMGDIKTTINDPEAIKEGFKKALIETKKETLEREKELKRKALEKEEEMKRVEEQKKKDAKRILKKKYLMEYKISLDHLPFRRIELERNHIDEGKILNKLKKSYEKSVLICFSVLFLSIFLILNLFFHWSTFPFQIIFSSILGIFLSSIIVVMFNDEYRSKEFWQYNSVFNIRETEYKKKLSELENQKLLLTQSILNLERELSDEL